MAKNCPVQISFRSVPDQEWSILNVSEISFFTVSEPAGPRAISKRWESSPKGPELTLILIFAHAVYATHGATLPCSYQCNLMFKTKQLPGAVSEKLILPKSFSTASGYGSTNLRHPVRCSKIRMSSVPLPCAYLPGLSARNASQLVSLGICRLMSNRGLKGSALQQKMLL